MKKIILSFKKLKNLLEKNNYFLESVYCEKEFVRFLSCKSPKYQKPFFIYVSEKYSLKNADDVEKHNIKISQDTPSQHHIEFISHMKGELLECDLVLMSCNDIFLYFDNGDFKYYLITDDSSSRKKKEKSKSTISSLIDKSNKILKKIESDEEPIEDEPSNSDSSDSKKEDSSLEEISGEESPEEEKSEDSKKSKEPSKEKNLEKKSEKESPVEKDLSKKDPTKSQKLIEEPPIEDERSEILSKESPEEVELVFENEKGEVMDDVKMFLDEGEEDPSSKNSSKKKSSKKSSDNDSKNETVCIQEIEIDLGIILICVTISNFFKKIQNYESELVEQYSQLDENEIENRNRKLKQINELCSKFLEVSKDRVAQKTKKEKKLKNELIIAISVMVKILELKKKVEENPSKYQQDIAKVNDIYEQTKNTIRDLNIEILKVKDDINELLSNYCITLQESLKL